MRLFRKLTSGLLLLPRAAVAACLTACLAAGCVSYDGAANMPNPDEGTRVDQRVVTSVQDAAVANAILAQHTLYSYHFVANSKDLNELGERDLAVLADFYKANPGNLNIRRGDVPAAIYDARVHAVQDALARDGVEVARVKIAAQLPPGPEMASEDVIHILQMNWKEAGKGYSDTGGEATSGGGNQSSSPSSGTGGSSTSGGMP